jgi:bifunctional DNase/RNase
MIPVDVRGLVVPSPGTPPVLLIRETDGDQRWLAITIGAGEAEAFAAVQEGSPSGRPDTVELIGEVIDALGRHLVRVEVTELRDNIFYAELVLDGELRVSARPSDAIAIGLRARVPLVVAEAVLSEASVEISFSEAGDADPEQTELNQEQEIDEFRDLLDTITADDFDNPGPA